MILASRLTDGRVVFLAADGSWTDDIAAGALITGDATARRLLGVAREAEARNVVVGAYLIDVITVAGKRIPVSFREGIRASGPTVRTGAGG